jgi:hypothetical protein
MKRVLLALSLATFFSASNARAEFLHVDLTIFGMD